MVTVANVVTAVRLVFFVLFVGYAHQGRVGAASIMFLLAWGLDAVDGMLARRLHQETSFGYLFDKVVDRVVVFAGLLVLLINQLVPGVAAMLLVKEVVTLPVIISRYVRGGRVPSMGVPGKVLAVLQGVGILWALAGVPYLMVYVLVVAVLSGVFGGRYVYRFYYG